MLIFGCSTSPDITVRPEPRVYAWWLRLNVPPTNTVIRGVPVQQIEKTWRAAYEYKKEDLPQDILYRGEVDLMEENNISFSLEGDFNHDSMQDIALVGNYRNVTGEEGNFLLILTEAEIGDWRRSFLEVSHGGEDYMAIDQHSTKGIQVWFCLYCDHGTLFTWVEEKNTYIRQLQDDG